MQAWEYTTLVFDIQSEAAGHPDGDAEQDRLIAELGAAGWELVTVVPLVFGVAPPSPRTTHERWVFRRLIDPGELHYVAAEVTGTQEQEETPPISAMKEIANPREDKDSR